MNSQIQQPRQDQQTRLAAIKRKIQEKQALNPALSFQKAWEELQREQPHLFEEPESLRPEQTPTILPPNVTLSEAIRLYRQLTPGQVVQAHLNGMLPDGTPWSPAITNTVLAARLDGFGRPLPQARLTRDRPNPQSPLDKRVNEIKDMNTGMSVREITEMLRQTEPELFGDDDDMPSDLAKQAEAQKKQARLLEAVEKTRAEHPELSFATAYNQTVTDHPHLLDGMTRAIGDLED